MESNEEESLEKKDTDDEESNNGEESDIEDVEDKLEDGDQDRRKQRRSQAWQFFDVIDAEQRLASCSLCQERFSYRTTSGNLAKHLQTKHCIKFVKEDPSKEEDDIEREDLEDGPRRRPKASAAWAYFAVVDARRRVAQCRLCGARCSFHSTVSNLMKHVRRKHAGADGLDGSTSPPLSTPHKLRDVTRSAMWNYFKMVDPEEKIARCLVCHKRLSYRSSVTNLKRHLYRKHPRLKIEDDGNRVLISSDGQLYEIESKEERLSDGDHGEPTIDIDSVFIDDYDGEENEVTDTKDKGKRQKKRKKITLENTCDNDTDSDEITFQKRYTRKKTDPLDQFGKYLVSIMKELPKETANRLQMDFVKQVMTAQLTCDARQKIPVTSNVIPVPVTVTNNGVHVPEPVTNNGYAITISSSQISSDHQYVVGEHIVESQ